MNYTEELNEVYKKLGDYMEVNRVHFDTLERERVANKQKLNDILGLNEGNNYRAVLESRLSEAKFREASPLTTKFIAKIIRHIGMTVADNEFSITENKISTGEKTYVKLSKKVNQVFENGFPREWNDEFCESCRELGINSYTGNYMSNLLDMVKPKTVILSTNLYDILTSSTDCSYSSCYRMDNGEYFNGNLSYARDSFTAIIFTYSDDIHRKIGRTWAYIFPEKFKIITPEKPYGSLYKEEKKVARKYIEQGISKYMGVRPYWKYINGGQYDDCLFSNGRGPVYFDYDRVGIAYHKHKTDDSQVQIDFADALCLQCGDETEHPEGGCCYDCFEESDYCECCDSHFRGESYSHPHGGSLCSSCFEEYYSICRYCGDTVHNEDSHHVENYGDVCDHCCRDHFQWCPDCESYCRLEDMTHIHETGEDVCDSCLSDYYLCDGCQEYSSKQPTEHEGNKLCKFCLEAVMEEKLAEVVNV